MPIQEICDYFNIYSSGKLSKASVRCYGTSRGKNLVLYFLIIMYKIFLNYCFQVLKVAIEPSSLNFGQCDISQTTARTFEITNYGEVEVAFQVKIIFIFNFIDIFNFIVLKFDSDSTQSSFWLSCMNGKLKSGETKLIQVILKPQYSIIYHKKLACLIENHVRMGFFVLILFLTHFV